MTSNLNIVNDTIRCFIRSTETNVEINTAASPLYINAGSIMCTSNRGTIDDLVLYIMDLSATLQELTSTVTNLRIDLDVLTNFKTNLTQI
jgi:hypothetical protein